MILPALGAPFQARLDADLQAGQWALWLWRHEFPDLPSAEGHALFRSLQVLPLDQWEEGRWTAAFLINGRIDESTGRAAFITERVPPLLYYASSEAHAAQSGRERGALEFSSGPRDIDFLGVLMFSEAPVRLSYRLAVGEGGAPVEVEPVAVGGGARFVAAAPPDPPRPVSAGDVREASYDGPGGFSAVWAVAHAGPPYVGDAEYEVEVDYPDGERRQRSVTWSRSLAGDPSCFPTPDPTNGQYYCDAEAGNTFVFMDLTNSCQPAGRVAAQMTYARSAPNVTPLPVVLYVPYDYCPLVGADQHTPHPCVDMTTTDFQGCPD